jgi:hypothetical protein
MDPDPPDRQGRMEAARLTRCPAPRQLKAARGSQAAEARTIKRRLQRGYTVQAKFGRRKSAAPRVISSARRPTRTQAGRRLIRQSTLVPAPMRVVGAGRPFSPVAQENAKLRAVSEGPPQSPRHTLDRPIIPVRCGRTFFEPARARPDMSHSGSQILLIGMCELGHISDCHPLLSSGIQPANRFRCLSKSRSGRSERSRRDDHYPACG